MKRTLIAASIALLSTGALGANYYLVTPVNRAASSAAPVISVALGSYVLPSGMVSVPYAGFDLNSLLTVTGDPDYTGTGATWRVASGAIPDGLSLSASGQLSGTPTAAGTGRFTLEATYKTKTGTQSYQVVVANLSVSLAGATLPTGTAGQVYEGYDLKPLVSSSAPNFDPYKVSWSVVAGALPAGIQLNPVTGMVSGTPTQAGSNSFTVRATYQGATGEQLYDLPVTVSVVLQPATLAEGYTNTAYSYDLKPLLQVTGDTAPDASLAVFAVKSGSLPAGLSLSADGLLSGTPSAAGASSFVLQVTYKGSPAEQSYSIPVSLSIADAVWDSAKFGGTHTGSPTYSNGNHTVVLPAGLNGVPATKALPTAGKWYWEVLRTAGNYGVSGISVIPITSHIGNGSNGQTYSCGAYYNAGTPALVASATGASKSATNTTPTSDVFGLAYDATVRTVSIYHGNVLMGTCTVTGTTTLYPTVSNASSANGGSGFTLRTLPAQQTYSPPTGYTAGLPQ